MKVIAFNGSPRPQWNTATLLKKALEGAASRGAETQLVNLYDLHFTGCRSCFACKTKGGSSYGKCAVEDDLTPFLKLIEEADVVILGAPIYMGTVTGEMKSFLERLVFPYFTYTDPPQSLFPKSIQTAFIYTMGIKEEQLDALGIGQHIGLHDTFLKLVFGASETLLSFDTYQFSDYSKVLATRFNAEEKTKRRREVFPQDCAKAIELGARLVDNSISSGRHSG